MKQRIAFMSILLLLLFSTNVYAQPVTDQNEFEAAIGILGEIEITLGNNITFDSGYNSRVSDVTSIGITTVDDKAYTLSADKDSKPERLFTQKYNSSDEEEFTLTLSGNISISDFEIFGEDNISNLGLGGAIYLNNIGKVQSQLILKGTGSFKNNRALGGDSAVSSSAPASYSGYGGAVYGNKVTLESFKGSFENNSAIGGNSHAPSDESYFAYAYSTGWGGAIYGDEVTLTNFEGSFKGNRALGGNAYGSSITESFITSYTDTSGYGGAIYGTKVTLTNFKGSFEDNSATGGNVYAEAEPTSMAEVYASNSGYGGAIYGTKVTLTNFEGSFKGNSALGGNASAEAASDATSASIAYTHNSGYGGAIYGNEITLTKFKGSFEDNIATSGSASSKVSGDGIAMTKVYSSGRGGAIYISATGDSHISGGLFKGNSASTNNIGDTTSGLGGAIFFDVRKDNVKLILTSSVDTPISFIKNTHAPGGEVNKTYNSIYLGTTLIGNEVRNVTLSVEVDEDAYLVMKDPMASQEDSMEYTAERFYNSIVLAIDKTGEGTWILGGHNDMQSKTTWTISEGILQLSEDLASKEAHIDLSHDDSSFTMAEGTSLLLEFTKNGHKIQAEEIKLESTIAPTDADYGNLKEGDTYTLLKLISENISVDEDSISESGKVTVGAFDYTYTDGKLLNESDDEPNVRNYVVTIDSKKFDPIKGGVDLLMAPLATSVMDIVRSDMFYSENKVNTWAKLGYGVTNHADYRADRINVTLGTDLRLIRNTVFGLTGGWSKVFFEGLDTSMEGNTIDLGIHTAIRIPYEIEIAIAGGFSRTNYAYTREGIEGDLHSRTFKAGLEIGRGFELVKNLTLSPNLGYTYMNVFTGDVDEISESARALHIDSHTENVHRISAGASLAYDLLDKALISLRAEYVGTFGDTSVKSNAYFSNDPLEQRFETYSEKAIDTHAFKIGLEGKVDLSENIFLLVDYTFKIGANSNEHQGKLRFQYIW